MGYGNGGESYGPMATTAMDMQRATGSIGTPVRQAGIPARLEDLNKHTEALHQAIALLDDRLSAALMPSAPQTTEKSNVAPAESTPLGNALADLGRRVRNAVDRIGEISQRIEL